MKNAMRQPWLQVRGSLIYYVYLINKALFFL